MRAREVDRRGRFEGAVVIALAAALLPALYGVAGLVTGHQDDRATFSVAFLVAGAVAATPWLVLREGTRRRPAAAILLAALLLAVLVLVA